MGEGGAGGGDAGERCRRRGPRNPLDLQANIRQTYGVVYKRPDFRRRLMALLTKSRTTTSKEALVREILATVGQLHNQDAKISNQDAKIVAQVKRLEAEILEAARQGSTEGAERVVNALLARGRALWRLQAKRIVVTELRRTYSISAACKKAGIDRTMLHRWRQTDPAFDRACHDAIEDALDRVEGSVYERALKGDTQAAIALLRAGRPEKYRPEGGQTLQQIRIENLIYAARNIEHSPSRRGIGEPAQARLSQESPTQHILPASPVTGESAAPHPPLPAPKASEGSDA